MTTSKRLTIAEVMARLNISRATVYRRPFLRRTMVQEGSRSYWLESDIERYDAQLPRGVREQRRADPRQALTNAQTEGM